MREQNQQNPDHDASADPFYVGYLPMPQTQQRTTLLTISLLAIWLSMMGCVLVLTQRDPGNAVWDNSNEQTLTGIFVDHPYPMLIPDDQDSPRTLLVVSMGKKGAHDRLVDANGHRVTLRGYELHREGRRLLELASDENAIQIYDPIDAASLPKIAPAGERKVELIGEILDGKCYLGAMKPGDGIGHRSCAMLCLRGGLPPMFVAHTEIGDILYPLLMVDGSTRLEEHTIAMVARRVRIRGQIATIAGLPVLQTTAADIEPTDGVLNP